MEKILTFKEHSEELNEGWKTNIFVGLLSLFGSQAIAHNDVTNKQHITAQTHTENALKSFIKQGWTLDSIAIDTLFQKIKVQKPDTNVMVTRLKFDKNEYFESGKFTLSQSIKDSISNAINQISVTGPITNIVITSSTDKQGLSQNLQTELKKLGYSPDNKGLSDARAASVIEYLKSFGINGTLIEVQSMFEQGGEIDQSARFVSLDIYYLEIPEELPQREETVIKKINKTYYVSKDVNYKHQHIHSKITKIGPIRLYKNIKAYECSSFK